MTLIQLFLFVSVILNIFLAQKFYRVMGLLKKTLEISNDIANEIDKVLELMEKTKEKSLH